MELDACYAISEGEEYKLVKRFVDPGSCKIAIISATDNLYSNKKNVWAALDVLDKDGYVAIQCSLHDLDKVLPGLKDTTYTNFDIVLFENEEIGGRSGCCFYDSTIPFVFVYKDRKPMCWRLENTKNTYRSRPNVFHIPPTEGIQSGETFQITTKLLEPSQIKDTILVLGERSFHHIPDIKNLCRYIVAFGYNPLQSLRYLEPQGIRVYRGNR